MLGCVEAGAGASSASESCDCQLSVLGAGTLTVDSAESGDIELTAGSWLAGSASEGSELVRRPSFLRSSIVSRARPTKGAKARTSPTWSSTTSSPP